VTGKVTFHPLAFDDLDAIDDLIARDSPRAARDFVDRIRQFCNSLEDFPERGCVREEFGEGIRTMSFERRVVIAYRLDSQIVLILRIFYAGQNYGPESFAN
jgi:toxin ParE1/3/4